MPKSKLMIRVRLVGTGMVPDYEALEDRVVRFHGWKHRPKDKTDPNDMAGGFVSTLAEGDVLTLPFRREYLDELRAGVLVPADVATAKLTRIPMPAPKAVAEGA